MALEATAIRDLLGAPATRTRGLDLLGGNPGGFNSALLGAAAPKAYTNLTSAQQTSLTSLQSFVKNNVEGPQAEALQAQIQGLQQLFRVLNSNNPNLEPVYDFFQSNYELASLVERGSLVDQLI